MESRTNKNTIDMITERKFLEALRVVREYQKQINDCVNNLSNAKEVLLDDWLMDLSYNNELSLDSFDQGAYVRTVNGLKSLVHYRETILVSEVTWEVFRLGRNVGKKSWETFVEMRNRKIGRASCRERV